MKTAKTLLLVLLIVLPTIHHAQTMDLILKGTVKSAEQDQPIPGVIVQLIRDNKDLQTVTSAQDGIFEFQHLSAGTYLLTFRMLGFIKIERTLVMDKSQDMGMILMSEEVKSLKEITVTGSQMLVEHKPGVTIYNVARDEMAIGKSLVDVASLLPGISQTGTGSLTYGGEGGVVILINGRKSNISPADILQQIQSANVEKLELITGADPRFASAGGAATLNIVLKKNKTHGLSGNASFSMNSNAFLNAAVGITKFNGKVNYYTTLSSDDRFLQMKTSYERRLAGDSLLFRGGINNSTHHSLRSITSGIDFYADSLNIISLEHYVSFHSDNMDAVNYRSMTNEADAVTTHVRSAPQEWENILSLNHQRNFKAKNKFLESEVSATLFHLSNEKIYGELQQVEDLRLNNYSLRARSDYSAPLKTGSFNIGVDMYFINTQNLMQRKEQSQQPNEGERFTYQNEKMAIYTSFTLRPTSKLSIRPGLRLERAHTEAKMNVNSAGFERTTLYPSLNILFEATKKSTFIFDFIRRIQYPELYSLYTTPNQADTLNLNKGNGGLLPAIRYDASLQHQYVTSKFNFTIRLVSRYSSNAILPRATTEAQNRMSIYSQNVGNVFGYGGTVSFSWNISKWTIRAGSNLNFSNADLFKDVNTEFTRLYSMSGYLTNRYNFSTRAEAEVSFRVMNYSRTLSEQYDPMYNLQFQFNYKISKAKWVVSLLANDVLFTMVNRGSIIPDGSITHDLRSTHLTRFIQATLRYKFGNTAKSRDKKLQEEKIQFSNG